MERNYVKGNARSIKTQFGDVMNVSLCLKDLEALQQNKWYVRITIAPRREVWQFWDTHYIYQDAYAELKEEWKEEWKEEVK